MINPQWLKTFVTLVEQGSFTRTAEQLAMTQPGVSQHIKKLEDYYATALLNRYGKQFELTPAGEQVYRFAHNLLAREQDLREQLKSDDPHAGLCRITSPGALGLRLYPRLVLLQQAHPELEIHYEVAPNHRIESELISNRIELGLMTRQPSSANLVATSSGQERLCLVTARNMTATDYSALCELGLISHPDAEHHTTLVMQANFPKQFTGMSDLPVRGYVNQINLILEPVAAGLGFTVLPASAVASYRDTSAIRTAELPETVHETIYRVSKKYRPLPVRYQFLYERLFTPDESTIACDQFSR